MAGIAVCAWNIETPAAVDFGGLGEAGAAACLGRNPSGASIELC